LKTELPLSLRQASVMIVARLTSDRREFRTHGRQSVVLSGAEFERRAAAGAIGDVANDGAKRRAPPLQGRFAGRARLADFLLEHSVVSEPSSYCINAEQNLSSTVTTVLMHLRFHPDAHATET